MLEQEHDLNCQKLGREGGKEGGRERGREGGSGVSESLKSSS